ncbi:MAG: co-chaperone GroES [Armatimonadetes bacterium]|nr:co-chaperone GroES [Armatimonadota bacterium]
MHLQMGELIIVGDRVLIEPIDSEQKTQAGLVLPATVTERDQVRGGRVVKVGPGYLTANPDYSEDQPWRHPHQAVRYLPLQAEPGDYAFFLRKEAVEIKYQMNTFLIVPHSAILALLRPDSQDILENVKGLLGSDE